MNTNTPRLDPAFKCNEGYCEEPVEENVYIKGRAYCKRHLEEELLNIELRKENAKRLGIERKRW